jgi:hypothetical protein
MRRMGASLTAVGLVALGLSLFDLGRTSGVAEQDAATAIKTNGGSMDSASYQSVRQISANVHLEQCGLVGLAGIAVLATGVVCLTRSDANPATRG